MEKEKVLEAIKKLKESKEKKFVQSVDLTINLKNFDIKKESVNLFINMPHKIKEIKVAGFLENKNPKIDTITKNEFAKYKNKQEIKRLVGKYDFFVASIKLMPQIATIFGRYLGPVGKMPSPQLGILKEESSKEIAETIEKVEKIVRVKSKEPSLKFSIGKNNMKDEDIADNVIYSYNFIMNALPRKKENIKSVMIKFTMSKPERIEF